MSRPLRIEYEGAFYHVTARGNERRNIFFAESDYEKFKAYLKDAQEKHGFLLHCYVLMTNHYHLLIETPNANISKIMHYVNASYTNYLNKKRERVGHLFQGRYKAIIIDYDSYLLELSRYLHLNPVRAHMIEKPEAYPYSSYRSYISRTKEDIVSRDFILKVIAGNSKGAQQKYKEFVERMIGEEEEHPLKNVYGGVILGGKSFIKETLNRIREPILHQEEISQMRELQNAWKTDGIIEAICTYFKINRDDLIKDKKQYRNITIYLLKKHTGMTNRKIGELFGDMSYSAVSKAYQRFSTKVSGNRYLRKIINRFNSKMSHVKT